MHLTREQSLVRSRVVWSLFILWLVFCALAHVALVVRGDSSLFDSPALMLMQVVLAMLLLPAMWAIRSGYYKAHWVKDAVTPLGYLRAHEFMGLLPFAITLAVVFTDVALLGVVAPLILLLAMLAMFPDGKPMQDHPVRL